MGNNLRVGLRSGNGCAPTGDRLDQAMGRAAKGTPVRAVDGAATGQLRPDQRLLFWCRAQCPNGPHVPALRCAKRECYVLAVDWSGRTDPVRGVDPRDRSIRKG
ncbi:MAG TPA: hypothetical protein VLG92_03580 [Candidatus Saccharimonadia bacterium]|nr:hypothetical protein [Candidatus Saccharimonadia bacterium]